METKQYHYRHGRRVFLGGFLILVLGWTSTSWAFPHHGDVVDRMPKGHRSVWIGRSHFCYHGGAYYRKAPRGFVVVAAPLGAVVGYLPVRYATIVIGGIPYYSYAGVYYRRVPSGYLVVEPPPPVAVQVPPRFADPRATAPKRVVASADRLNVRSGPGLDQPVVAQILRGVVLVVQGSVEGWWYVQLPSNSFGWVQSRFTTDSPESPASG